MADTRILAELVSSAEEAIKARDYERALELTYKALQIDDLHDGANMLHLEALGGLRRRSEVVAHYQEYVSKLAEASNDDDPNAGGSIPPIAA
jgi:two-component SAPR family response regulator